MYRIIADDVRRGLHPSEIAAYFITADGDRIEEFVLSSRSLDDRQSVQVGFPVGQRADGAYLVELPREASSGTWRIWTRPDRLLRENGSVILIPGMAEDEFCEKPTAENAH